MAMAVSFANCATISRRIEKKATAKGGPLDGQEVECNGNTLHVPIARIGKPATMFFYDLREEKCSCGLSKFVLIPHYEE